MMTVSDDLDLALAELLDAIYAHYHYDFRHHVRSLVARRVARALTITNSTGIAELQRRIVDDPDVFATLLGVLTIQVSDLFRDPRFFRAVREHVIPHLATYPSIKIWIAGCGYGEEAYSFAIALDEAGLLERTLIYATDIDRESLRIAESGAYALDRVRGFTHNYFDAGGTGSLADYYTTAYDRAVFAPHLRKRIVVADHCLATDAAFAEVQLVSCRNVLIYFDRHLQDRTVGLFRDSLCARGFLSLGTKESLALSSHAHAFEPFAPSNRIYRLAPRTP